MTAQLEAFPKTARELAEEFLQHFQDDVEKAEKALVSAESRLCAARLLRDDAEENLRRVIAGDGNPYLRAAADLGLVDPETGEVRDPEDGMTDAEADAALTAAVFADVADPDACPDCHGEGRLPDKTGGGHHTCNACHGSGFADHFVVVSYPNPDEGDLPARTEVGQFTRYGELVADYSAAAGIPVTMGEYEVVGEEDGRARDLGAVIEREDYGKRLLVRALAKEAAS